MKIVEAKNANRSMLAKHFNILYFFIFSRPRSKGEYLFVIGQLFFGLLLFATVLGHVANIVTSVSAARKEFQGESSSSFSHVYLFALALTSRTLTFYMPNWIRSTKAK